MLCFTHFLNHFANTNLDYRLFCYFDNDDFVLGGNFYTAFVDYPKFETFDLWLTSYFNFSKPPLFLQKSF